MDSALPPLGWLVFAWGTALIAMAVFSSKARLRSPTKRFAEGLNGLVFCLLALQVMLGDLDSSTRYMLLGAAVVTGLVGWWLSRHSRRVDHAVKARKQHL